MEWYGMRSCYSDATVFSGHLTKHFRSPYLRSNVLGIHRLPAGSSTAPPWPTRDKPPSFKHFKAAKENSAYSNSSQEKLSEYIQFYHILSMVLICRGACKSSVFMLFTKSSSSDSWKQSGKSSPGAPANWTRCTCEHTQIANEPCIQ